MELVLSFNISVVSMDRTQSLRGSLDQATNCLYVLSHLTGPGKCFQLGKISEETVLALRFRSLETVFFFFFKALDHGL